MLKVRHELEPMSQPLSPIRASDNRGYHARSSDGPGAPSAAPIAPGETIPIVSTTTSIWTGGDPAMLDSAEEVVQQR